MAMEVSQEEKDNQKKGAITSLTAHVAIFLIALLPWMTFPDPPPGPAGVLVSFGEPDQGMDLPDRAAPAEPVEAVEEVEEVEPEKPVEKPKVEKPKPKDPPKVNRDDNSKERAIAAAKKKEEDRKKKELADKKAKEKAEADREKREKEAAEKAKRDAEAAEKARIAAEKAKRDAEAKALKDAIGDAFGGSGSGGNPGDQGQPDGDPDGKALDGVSTGSGEIGGGLGGRGVLSKPRITDNSQKTGDVVMKVCVDASGRVSEAKYTQAGSTTSDPALVATAKKAAMKYKFSKGDVDRQCGTIKIKFRVR